ncbi:two-component regulator propeller domain-containing protein [Postechiella marina]|uniref:histidine kinase n=1 Tax=Postechiella marina TaxID=943941 RepID=A0ABP8C5F7_9FLAO
MSFTNKHITINSSKYLATILWVLLFLITSLATAQNLNHFERITTNNGLSQSDIMCIIQDNDGFMWFGTHDGLNKYDGYKFKVFNPNPNNPTSITSNLIYAIEKDINGNFWIGTTGDGLLFFDRSTEKFTSYKHDANNTKSLNSNHISSLYRDKENRLWIATGVGLNILDLNQPPSSYQFTRFNAIQEPFVINKDVRSPLNIFQDSKGQIWLGSFSGIYKLSRDSNGNKYFKYLNKSIDLPNVSVRCINEDKYGRLILGTDNGLYAQQLNAKSFKFEKIVDQTISKILIDNDKIWAGTENNGLLLLTNPSKSNASLKLTKKFIYDTKNPNSISKNRITSLYKDKTGIIWAGTNGGGVNKLNLGKKHFKHIRKTEKPNSLSYDKVRALFEDSNEDLWIGTDGGSINKLVKGTNNSQFINFNSIPSVYAITEIERNSRKKLLFGGQSLPALYEIDITNPNKITANSKIKIYNDFNTSVFSFLVDSKKTLWIGTYNGGVHRWVLNKDQTTYTKDIFDFDTNDTKSISSNIIRSMLEDSQGNIWFATGNGLSVLTKNETIKKHPKFEVFKNDKNNPNSLSHNYILSIYESKDNTLWIGTFGGGLDKFIPQSDLSSGTFKSYTTKDGLPNNIIKGILEDKENNLWLSSNKGLTKFNPKTETFKNHDVNDGLQNNEFQELASVKRKNGEILFGGINGYNAFFPEALRDNTIEPETIITDFYISNEHIAIDQKLNGKVLLKKAIGKTQKLDLNFNQNNISFEFSALHYAAPQKNQFAHKLDGFDTTWKYTKANNRLASYTNLSPGNYTLLVKASNNDGLWDSTPAKINISIKPPLWLTKLAYCFYLLLLIGLLFGLMKFTIINTTEKHKLELVHLEKEKNEELQQLKLEFFTNISHEIRTPLTLIKGPLEYLQDSYEKLDDKTVKQQLNLMQKNTDSLLRLINQLLGFRKMEKGKMQLNLINSNFVKFIQELVEPFQFLSHKRGVNFKIITPENITTWFDPIALEKIINNLLSNALKFTQEHGNITIEVFEHRGALNQQKSVNLLIIKVKDSGSGIPTEKIKYVFDRFYNVKNKKKASSEGTGIGLSYSKQLVEFHQGTIDVKSTPNEGSTFTVKLPMEEKMYLNLDGINLEHDNENQDFFFASTAQTIQRDRHDETIDDVLTKGRSKLPILLVIDDNLDIRNFIAQALQEDYTIYQAENGKEGLEMARSLQPNIVLTDVFMPIIDGFEFCKTLKTEQETSHIPVIMLTAKTSDESELKGFKHGADDYIRKPFNIDLLKIKLTNIILHRQELRKRFNRKIFLKPKEVTVTSADEKFLQRAIEIIEEHMMDTEFNVEILVKEMKFSRSNIYMKFKELTGLSSSEFIRNIRLKRAMQLLETSNLSVKEIMYMTGFNTGSYFSKCFKKQFGLLPSEYIKKIKSNDKSVDIQLDK